MLLQSSYQAFGKLNGPNLIRQFVEHEDSVGFRYKQQRQKDPNVVEKAVRESYKTLISKRDTLKAFQERGKDTTWLDNTELGERNCLEQSLESTRK